jgi:hypothetical protein
MERYKKFGAAGCAAQARQRAASSEVKRLFKFVQVFDLPGRAEI